MREVERRKLNVMEALIVAALIGLATMIFSMREAVIRLQATQEATNSTLIGLQAQLADVPALSQRVSRNEVQIEALQESQRELMQTRGSR